jgi:DNA-binding LacI/PurR family transcriptional regulator
VPGTETTLTPPTLADVAQAAGVSSATASRVLNGSPRVRPATRRQVEEAMASLGYVRNRAARSTGPRRTGVIALVVCEGESKLFSDAFFSRILRGVRRELNHGEQHYGEQQLVLLTAQAASEYRAAARYLRSGHVDGAMFVSMHGRHPIDLEAIGIPIVFVGRPVSVAGTLSYVDADNRAGGAQAARHLIASGRKVVATIAGPPDMAPGVDRLRGYRDAMANARMNDAGLIVYGDFSQVSGEHALYRLLDRRPDIEAVFAASDLMAAGVLRALHRTGRKVPDDVAVVGFDDSPLARHTMPQLTTIRQPIEEMGARMVNELVSLVSGAERGPRCTVFGTELVLRASA